MELLNKFAEDNNGKIIHIKNAVTGVEYYCPECKEKFILKKGNIRQHHFSHNNSSSNCAGTGEGYLHKAFKKMLFELLKSKISNKLPMNIYWKCNVCNTVHRDDILYDVIYVEEEYNLVECRPDIVLVNNNGKINIIIEIVNTHEPEQNVIDYCKNNGVTLLKIKLNSIEDLEKVENKIIYTSNVIFFNNMNCPYVRYLMHQQYRRQQIGSRIVLKSNNRNIQRGPKMDQVEAAHANKKTRQYYAIKNYYKNKSKRK